MTPREIYETAYRLERKRLANPWHTIILEDKQALAHDHYDICAAAERSLDMVRWSRHTGYKRPRGDRARRIVAGLSQYKAAHFPQPADPLAIPF